MLNIFRVVEHSVLWGQILTTPKHIRLVHIIYMALHCARGLRGNWIFAGEPKVPAMACRQKSH